MVAVLLPACLGALSAARLNSAYLLPSAGVKIDPRALNGPLFCALTFDDGPDSLYTPRIAAVLQAEGVRASFFVVGRNVSAYPEQVRSLAAAGHEICNHSYSHADLTKLSEARQRREISACAEVLSQLGISTKWFRPPYGSVNRRALRVAAELGVTPLLWSVDPRDWAEPGASVISSRVLKAAGNGAVILLHSTHSQTVEALPGVIRGLREKGFSFLTVSEWERAIGGGGLPAPLAPLPVDLNASPLSLPARPAGLEELGPQSPLTGDSLPVSPPLEETQLSLPSAGAETNAHAHGVAAATAARDAMAAAEDFKPQMLPPLPRDAPAETGGTYSAAEPQTASALSQRASAARRAFLSILPQGRLPAAKPDAPLTLRPYDVYSNFAIPEEAAAIWHGSRGTWHHWAAPDHKHPALGGSGEGSTTAPETIVEPGAELPVLPQAEEQPDSPPAQGHPPQPAATQGDSPSKTTGRPVPMDLVVLDLLDPSQPRLAWHPPAQIPAAVLSGGAAPSPDGGASAYFLSLAPNLDGYTAVELETYQRLARLGGLLISTDMGCPMLDAELPFPFAAVAFNELDRAAMLDLTVEGAPEAIDALAAGRQTLFVVVRPQNLHFFIAAHTEAVMNRGMADFVLLRQATAGLQYDTPAAFREEWQLPPGVDLARFSGAGREAVLLYKRGGAAVEVEVPSAFSHMSRLTIETGGYLRIAPLDAVTVTVSRTPAVLIYETGS